MKETHRLAEQMPGWLWSVGPYSETVIYSGAEVSRSLANARFWAGAGLGKRRQKNAVARAISTVFGQGASLSDLPKLVRGAVWEKCPYLKGVTTLFSPGEGFHAGVGPREALRFYSYECGALTEPVFRRAMDAADSLGRVLEFAYDPGFGFLNPDLEEIGSGLCFKALLHLPGMTRTDELGLLRETLDRAGVKVCGFMKGWPQPHGCLVTTTYRPGPGLRPTDAHDSFGEIIRFVVEMEKQSREALFSVAETLVEDSAVRALATLKVARLLEYDELVDKLSWIRVGVAVGALEPLPTREMNALLFLSGRNHMRVIAGQELPRLKEHIMRASLARAITGS